MPSDRWQVIDELYHKKQKPKKQVAEVGFTAKIIKLIWLKALTYNAHIGIIHILIKGKA